jgi:hypothetical protein
MFSGMDDLSLYSIPSVNLGMMSLFPIALNPEGMMKYCLSFFDLNAGYAVL